MKSIEMQTIGHVENEIDTKKDTGWASDVSRLVINPEYEQGLLGLADFSHVMVVCYLHQAHFEVEQHLVRRPQGREDMPRLGILAQRAKDRPNPIGVTIVELLGVSGNVVTVRGLDAIDGTPLLDIKPCFPQYDCREGVTTPEWVDRLMAHYF